MDDELHAYRKNIGTYFGRVAFHIIPAIIVGVIVDKISEKIQKKFKLGPLVALIIQILIVTIVLFIIEKYISRFMSDEWQGNTPGLFFVSFYFGLQFNAFSNISALTKNISGEKTQ